MATPGGAAETSALPLSRGGGGSAVPPSPSAESRHEQSEEKATKALHTSSRSCAERGYLSAWAHINSCSRTDETCKVTSWYVVACLA